MTEKTIQAKADEETYDDLAAVKRRHGLTWKGLLMKGALHVENCEPNLTGAIADGGDGGDGRTHHCGGESK